jgi:putative redox protein
VLIAQRPTLSEESLSEFRSRFVIEPLEPGFGYTLGNSLRRTLLSSIPGAADSAIHPGELMLVGLAGCTGIDVVSILKKMHIELSEFEVHVDAEAAEEHPRGWRKIKVSYLAAGKDIPEEKLKHAIELSQEKYCSVSATLRWPVEISYDYRIEKRD